MLALTNMLVKRMLVIALVLLSACRDSDKNSSLIFEELNESLQRSNKIIDNSSAGIILNLKAKLNESETAEKAQVWAPVADSVYTKAKYLVDFIRLLKSSLKQGEIEIGNRISKDLYTRLINFKEYILKKDALFKADYKPGIDILDKNIKEEAAFYNVNFLNKNTIQKSGMLSKIENNLLVATNEIVTFCDNQAMTFHCGILEKFQPIAVINSNKFGIGDELVIDAGIGAFKLTGRPSFEINGINIKPNENGVAEYRIKVKGEPGKYNAHVKIKYTAPDGSENTLEKNIQYSVIDLLPIDKKVQVSDTTMSP